MHRRTHKKSRAGCVACKQRRIKCDELHPICSHCKKRKAICHWESDLEVSIFGNALSTSLSSSDFLPTSFALDMNSLELLHHYSTVTCYTYSDHPDRLEVYRSVAPRIALSNDFLMHSLLAQAALHLAFLRTNAGSDPSRYFTLASQQHKSLVNTFLYSQIHGAPSVAAKHLCNLLLNIFTIATAPSSSEPSIYYWLDSLQIRFHQVRADWEELLLTEMSPLLRKTDLDLCPVSDTTIYGRFPEYLQRLITCDAPDSDEIRDETVRHAYELSMGILHKTWQATLVGCLHATALNIWPFLITDKFRSLLLLKRPRALVLLAHYCALFIYADRFCWWSQGRGYDDLMKAVALLDNCWLKWVEWPLSVAVAMSTTASATIPAMIMT